MKRIIIGLLITVVCIHITSCDSFLEAIPQDKITDEGFWKSESDVSKFLIDAYASTFVSAWWFPENIHFLEACSDNSNMLWDGWYTDVKKVANGTQDTYGTFPHDVWALRYATIRKCNQIFENIDKIPNIDEQTVSKIKAETQFIFAYNYYMLTTLFGDVPFVTNTLLSEESKQISRDSKTEIINNIIGQLDQASAVLESSAQDFGRATWGACQMLKARIYMVNNNYPKLLEVTNELLGKYSLNTIGETPYEDLFSGKAELSNEIIFSIIKDKTTGSVSTGSNVNQSFFLKGMSGGDQLLALMPTGTLVDSYPMADGRLIHEEGSLYNPTDPYKDRDPRFYQSIYYPTGDIIYYSPSVGVAEYIFYDPESELSIPTHRYNAPWPSATGYVWKKYVDPTPHALNQITDCTNDHILMRYAEVLLMRAEALAEIEGTGAKSEIIDLIDMLRNRCKGGVVHRENYSTKEDLINLVRNERRIELANEGLRYFDIVRWKLAEKNPVNDGCGLNGDVYGAYMRKDGIGSTDPTIEVDGVARRFVETYYFDKGKNYLQPIPQKEIDLNNNLTQNPGW